MSRHKRNFSAKSKKAEPKQDDKQVWRLPIPELAAKNPESGETENSDEKIKNLLKVVQLLRQVQSQKAQQGKLLIETFV